MTGKRTEQISSMELWSTMCIFNTSVAMVLPVGSFAGQQSWIAIILAIIFASLYALIYTHICDSYPGKSIIEIGELLLGKWVGKIIGLLYTWFGFHLSSLVMNNGLQFTSTVALPTTPQIVIGGTMAVLVVWIVYNGIEAIGRISVIFIPVVFLYTTISFILLSKDMDFRNILPIFGDNWVKVLYSAFQTSSLHLGETIMFVFVFQHLRKKGYAKIPSLSAIVVAGLLILTNNLMNILVMGNLATKLNYSTYATYSYIQVADFLDRAEIMIYTIFITMTFIKMSICFYAAAYGIAAIFGIKDYRTYVVPLGLLMLELSLFVYSGEAETIQFALYTLPFYAIPLELLIPLLLLTISVFKKKLKQSVK